MINCKELSRLSNLVLSSVNAALMGCTTRVRQRYGDVMERLCRMANAEIEKYFVCVRLCVIVLFVCV